MLRALSTFRSANALCSNIRKQALSSSSRPSKVDDSFKNVVSVGVEGSTSVFQWSDGLKGRFHNIWLRDNCKCPECYNETSKQRFVDTFTIPLDIAPISTELSSCGNHVDIEWPAIDGAEGNHTSRMHVEDLRQHCYWASKVTPDGEELEEQSMPSRPSRRRRCSVTPQMWDGNTMRQRLQPHDFNAVTAGGSEEGQEEESEALRAARVDLATYGIMLLNGMPNTREGVSAIAERLGFVQETFYGRIWATAVEEDSASVADTAYTNLPLGLHTDGTYFTDQPGLQLFNCVKAAPVGGSSRFLDGFTAVELLRQQQPEAFEFFCRTPFLHYSVDPDARSLQQGFGPIIDVGPGGEVRGLRFNDYDRSPVDHLAPDQVEAYYRHHKALCALVRHPGLELSVTLKEGEMLVFENTRVLHGRHGFSGSRKMIGCYVSRDEYESRLRHDGLRALM